MTAQFALEQEAQLSLRDRMSAQRHITLEVNHVK